MAEVSVDVEVVREAGRRIGLSAAQLGEQAIGVVATLVHLAGAAADPRVSTQCATAQHRWRQALVQAATVTGGLGAGLNVSAAGYELVERVNTAGFTR